MKNNRWNPALRRALAAAGAAVVVETLPPIIEEGKAFLADQGDALATVGAPGGWVTWLVAALGIGGAALAIHARRDDRVKGRN